MNTINQVAFFYEWMVLVDKGHLGLKVRVGGGISGLLKVLLVILSIAETLQPGPYILLWI